MKVPKPSPVPDEHLAPKCPDILSSAGAGVCRHAPGSFPDSSSVLDKFQHAIHEKARRLPLRGFWIWMADHENSLEELSKHSHHMFLCLQLEASSLQLSFLHAIVFRSFWNCFWSFVTYEWSFLAYSGRVRVSTSTANKITQGYAIKFQVEVTKLPPKQLSDNMAFLHAIPLGEPSHGIESRGYYKIGCFFPSCGRLQQKDLIQSFGNLASHASVALMTIHTDLSCNRPT